MLGVLHLIEDDLERMQHACADDLAAQAAEMLERYAAFDAWLQEHDR